MQIKKEVRLTEKVANLVVKWPIQICEIGLLVEIALDNLKCLQHQYSNPRITIKAIYIRNHELDGQKVSIDEKDVLLWYDAELASGYMETHFTIPR